MIYEPILRELCETTRGARGALLLDSGGEVVVAAGGGGEQLRLIGAYQAIALSAATRTAARYAAGSIGCLVSRYAGGTVLARPLNDGYFLVLALGPEASVALALHRSIAAGDKLNEDI